MALAIGENGSENNALHVLDLETGQLIDGPIPGVRFKAISWWPDSRRFVYPRLKDSIRVKPMRRCMQGNRSTPM